MERKELYNDITSKIFVYLYYQQPAFIKFDDAAEESVNIADRVMQMIDEAEKKYRG